MSNNGSDKNSDVKWCHFWSKKLPTSVFHRFALCPGQVVAPVPEIVEPVFYCKIFCIFHFVNWICRLTRHWRERRCPENQTCSAALSSLDYKNAFIYSKSYDYKYTNIPTYIYNMMMMMTSRQIHVHMMVKFWSWYISLDSDKCLSGGHLETISIFFVQSLMVIQICFFPFLTSRRHLSSWPGTQSFSPGLVERKL